MDEAHILIKSSRDVPKIVKKLLNYQFVLHKLKVLKAPKKVFACLFPISATQ